ncbi:hypothetical protein B0H14DRAFT_3423199 [Mycena olivaceomarginata]|nr:hypothetical protein B0H14DRAFT_3423199 [Mycena olivaceomarginata]
MAQPQPRQNPLLEGAQGSRASLASAMNRARAARDALLSKGYHSPTVNTSPIRNEHRAFHSSSPPPSPSPSPLSPSSADSQVDEEEPPPSDAEESEEEGDAGADSDVENVLRPPTPPPSGRGGGGASNTLTSNARGGTPPTAYSRLDPAPSASPDTLVHRALSSPPSNHVTSVYANPAGAPAADPARPAISSSISTFASADCSLIIQ